MVPTLWVGVKAEMVNAPCPAEPASQKAPFKGYQLFLSLQFYLIFTVAPWRAIIIPIVSIEEADSEGYVTYSK